MNNYFMSGKLMHKASDHNTKRCEVEKWVFLPHSDFERLKANPYQEHEAITAARDLMYEDKNAYHCIKEIKIYDPTSGSGSLLINIGKSVSKHTGDDNNIIYYAQELKANTYNLTRMNLVMRGILADNIKTRNGDTLEEDWPYFDDSDPVGTYEPLYVDAVVSNPPYSQNWDPANKESDPRYSRFGLAPKSKADYAFLLHDLFHIKPDGIMTIVLPHGVLFRGGEEGEIRKNLIEQNHIDAIIGLPANIFFGTGIPTIIMVLRQKRENTDVLIVDASKGFEKVGKNNKLRSSDIRRIADAVTERRDIPKYSRKVSRDEIRQNDYNLNIPRYVDSSETAESWDIYASMFGGIPNSELDNLSEFWTAFPNLRSLLFKAVYAQYSETAVDDVKTAIMTSADVTAFRNKYENAFDDITAFLESRLLDNMQNMVIHTITADSLFFEYYEQWIKVYKEGAIRNVTMNKYLMSLAWLKKLIPNLKLGEMTRINYQQLINDYAELHERQTTMDFHHQIKCAILDAVDEGLIARDPTRKAIIKGKAPRKKKPKYLNQFELHTMLNNLKLTQDISWDWFILLVAKTGMRFSEALALTPKDFDFPHQTLSINKTWDYKCGSGFLPTKNKSSVRKIQMDWLTVIQFSSLVKGLPEDKPIFVKEGKYVYNSTVNSVLERHCKAAKVPVITIHGLRHTHASLLLFAGVSIASVARRLGHASMTTTQKTYLHIIQELENKDINLVMRSLSELC